MIDLHSHILPGIDDGAQTLDEAIAMARSAVRDGIRVVAATPHHNNGRYANERGGILSAVASFNTVLDKLDIPLTVVSGQEIRMNDLFWHDWHADKLETLNGTRYMLVELPTQQVPKDFHEFVHEMQIHGVIPIIAHPERNAELMQNPDALMELVLSGAWSQVTTHSLSGLFGKRIQQAALTMCRRNLVHIVASDAHNQDIRPFSMTEAYDCLTRELGADHVRYYQNNAQAVIEDQTIESWEPKQEKRWRFWR